MRLSFVFVRVSALVVVLAVGAVRGGEPPAAGAKPLTPEQQERLKERDRYDAEAKKLRQEGNLEQAITVARRMLAVERIVFGDVHEDVAGSLQLLAEMAELREDFPAARQARQEVLAIRRKLHGKMDWRVAEARLGLADVDRLSKLTPENRRRLRQANGLNEQVFSLWQRGRSREALPLARKALAIRLELLGEDHPQAILSVFNLAAQYQALHRYEDAKALYQQARDLFKRTLGVDHPHYATSLNNLAMLYQDMGEYRQALPLLEQARDLRQDFPAARQVRQEVLAIRIKLYGDKDWRVADARLDLADVDRLGPTAILARPS
jgi:tetratricopeptide (TPR) repeat protein